MLLRTLKQLLPRAQAAVATTNRASTEVFYGPKSLQNLRSETQALHDASEAAYQAAFKEGHNSAAYGHLSECLRQNDTLVALNTGKWDALWHIKTAPLAHRAAIQPAAAPAPAAEPRAARIKQSARHIKAQTLASMRGVAEAVPAPHTGAAYGTQASPWSAGASGHTGKPSVKTPFGREMFEE